MSIRQNTLKNIDSRLSSIIPIQKEFPLNAFLELKAKFYSCKKEDLLRSIRIITKTEKFHVWGTKGVSSLSIGNSTFEFPIKSHDLVELLQNCAPEINSMHEKHQNVFKSKSIPSCDAFDFFLDGSSREFKLLETIRSELTPNCTFIKAKFDKICVYQKDSFSKVSGKNPKHPSHFGSLLLLMPAKFTGGDLQIHSAMNSTQFQDNLGSYKSVMKYHAFYHDTEYEILPLESGNRIILFYDLYFGGLCHPHPLSNKLSMIELFHDMISYCDKGICFHLAQKYQIMPKDSTDLIGSDALLFDQLKSDPKLEISIVRNDLYEKMRENVSHPLNFASFMGTIPIGEDSNGSGNQYSIIVDKKVEQRVFKRKKRNLNEFATLTHKLKEVLKMILPRCQKDRIVDDEADKMVDIVYRLYDLIWKSKNSLLFVLQVVANILEESTDFISEKSTIQFLSVCSLLLLSWIYQNTHQEAIGKERFDWLKSFDQKILSATGTVHNFFEQCVNKIETDIEFSQGNLRALVFTRHDVSLGRFHLYLHLEILSQHQSGNERCCKQLIRQLLQEEFSTAFNKIQRMNLITILEVVSLEDHILVYLLDCMMKINKKSPIHGIFAKILNFLSKKEFDGNYNMNSLFAKSVEKLTEYLWHNSSESSDVSHVMELLMEFSDEAVVYLAAFSLIELATKIEQGSLGVTCTRELKQEFTLKAIHDIQYPLLKIQLLLICQPKMSVALLREIHPFGFEYVQNVLQNLKLEDNEEQEIEILEYLASLRIHSYQQLIIQYAREAISLKLEFLEISRLSKWFVWYLIDDVKNFDVLFDCLNEWSNPLITIFACNILVVNVSVYPRIRAHLNKMMEKQVILTEFGDACPHCKVVQSWINSSMTSALTIEVNRKAQSHSISWWGNKLRLVPYGTIRVQDHIRYLKFESVGDTIWSHFNAIQEMQKIFRIKKK